MGKRYLFELLASSKKVAKYKLTTVKVRGKCVIMKYKDAAIHDEVKIPLL